MPAVLAVGFACGTEQGVSRQPSRAPGMPEMNIESALTELSQGHRLSAVGEWDT
jgi:hypothetical protein